MANKGKSAGSGVSMPVAVLGVVLALAVGFYLGFAARGMVGGKAEKGASGQAQQAAQNPAAGLEDRIASLEKQVKAEPANADAWTELGNVYFDADMPEKSVAAYGKALELRPNEPDVLTDQGVMYRRLAQFQQALDCFNKALALDPGHVIASYNKSIVLLHDKNDKAGALAALEALAAKKPDAVLPGGRPVAELIKEIKGAGGSGASGTDFLPSKP